MKEKHIVLRSSGTGTRDVFLGPLSLPSSVGPVAAGLSVEVREVDRSAIPAITNDGSAIAVAPGMPMKLVGPLNVQDVAAPGAATAAAPALPTAPAVSWGVKAVGADTSPFTGDGIVVAVLDTGIDASHPAFSGVDIVEKDFTGEGNGDSHGHGTHCAGTIFGRDVNGARIGVARGVKKALIAKVLGGQGGSSEMLASAIQWAVDNGAHVISMSLGIDFPGYQALLQNQFGFPPELATSRALEGYRANVQLFERLASFIVARGSFAQATITVAAAGNESMRDTNPDFEIAVSPPAVAEGVVSVAALGESSLGFVVANFSNTGANVAGPGVDIVSAKPGGGLVAMSGTSMATPHVAGVAALWAQKLRAAGMLNSLNLTSRLVGFASTTGIKPGFDPFDTGAGMVCAPQA